MIEQSYKLENLPPIFVVSLQESQDRRINLYRQFTKYGISNYHFCLYERFSECQFVITGEHADCIHKNSYGPTTSHILTNKYWTENTNYDYVLVLEDDVDISLIDLWNFSWDDLYRNIPEDWDCVQLSVMREFPDRDLEFRIRERYNHDFGCQAYLVKRHYAEEMAARYYRANGFHLELPASNIRLKSDFVDYLVLFPIVEHVVFETIGKVYSIPLFFEDLKNTITTHDQNIEDYRYRCYELLVENLPKYSFAQ